ncbi:hypothetical protein AXX12_06805 [Anaerosporomusa subterranea]|uniref:Uncharacterized protein n=1 Tax=Anaerosporomusa subterranea TaxID=1794912 RepID=A0A154BQD3_ANASB|nr:hypothetical protein [Anaerosporomusa subterranea]KYZ76146.1 hypothetical protein AXX12_06805 [Anaerosporomusa subterranea]
MESNTDLSGQGIQSRFAANLSMLFTEIPFLERFDLARLEYIPRPDSRSSLDWLADFDRGLRR